MPSIKSTLPLSFLLVLLLLHTSAAQQGEDLIPRSCKNTTTEELLRTISYLPTLPTIKGTDLEPVVCLGERGSRVWEHFL